VITETRKLAVKVTDLIHRNEYNFRVAAHNKVGAGKSTQLLKEVVAADPLSPPSAPENLTWSDVTSRSVVLSWKRPSNDGGCPVTSYVVEMREKDGEWKMVTQDHASESVTVLGQTEDKAYFYKVRAVNRIGAGTEAETKQPVVARDPLSAPVILVDELLRAGIEVRRGRPLLVEATYAGSPLPCITWFHEDEAEREIKNNPERNIELTTDKSTTRLRLAEAVRSDKGSYRLVAENDQGVDSCTLNVNVLDVPLACRGPWSFEDATNEAITLRWKSPDDDGGSEIINYVLEMKESNKKTWTTISSTVQSTKLRASKLVEGKEYVFRVCAENKLGRGPWLETSPYTAKLPFDVPDAPEKPEYVDVSRKSITLRWNEPDDGGSSILGYWLEKKEKSSTRWSRVSRDMIRTREHQIDSGLVERSTYQFRVCAENAAGCGRFSHPSDHQVCEDPVTAPSCPRSARVEDTTKNSISLAWDEPEISGGDTNFLYIVEQRLSDGSWSRCSDEGLRAQNYTVENLLEGQMYSFRVKCCNRGGESVPAVVPETAARDLIDLPRIELDTSVSAGITVNAGKSFSIPAKVSGKPYPDVTWSKDEESVSDRVEIMREDGLVTAKVKNCIRSDWGEYKITAKNSSGTKHAKCVVVVRDVPGKIADVKVSVISRNCITLKWPPPQDNGGSPIKTYSVEKRDMAMRAWLSVGTTDKLSIDVTNVIEGATYTFRVCAVNDMGSGVFTETLPVLCQQPLEVPGRPEGLRIEDIKNSEIKIRWLPPRADGGSKITGYLIDRIEESSEEWISCTGQPVVENTYTAKGLEIGKKYILRVKALNNVGEGKPAETGLTEAKEPEAAPQVSLDVGVKGCLQVRAGENVYLPAKISGVPFPHVLWTKNNETVVEKEDAVKIIDKNDECAVYIEQSTRSDAGTYSVCATNSMGSKAASCTVVVHDVPSVPVNFQASNVSSESMLLTWSAVEDNGGSDLLNYVLEKREGNKKTWTPVSNTIVDTKFKATKLNSGIAYQFRVAGENKFGVGRFAECGPVQAKDPFDVPGPPEKLQSSDVTKNTIVLTWQPPVNDGGAEIEGYWIEIKEKDSARWKKLNRAPVTKPPLVNCFFRAQNLVEGSQYKFRIGAMNKAGVGPFSEETELIRAEDPAQLPSKVSKPTISDVTSTSVKLGWLKPDDVSGTDVTGYLVEFQDEVTENWSKAIVDGEEITSKTEAEISGLKTGLRYKFRITACNKAGMGSPSDPTNFVEVKEQIRECFFTYFFKVLL